MHTAVIVHIVMYGNTYSNTYSTYSNGGFFSRYKIPPIGSLYLTQRPMNNSVGTRIGHRPIFRSATLLLATVIMCHDFLGAKVK